MTFFLTYEKFSILNLLRSDMRMNFIYFNLEYLFCYARMREFKINVNKNIYSEAC